jgi:hypothetical protein
MNLKLQISSEEKTYENIDSWWDLTSECIYKVINILETNWNFWIEISFHNKIEEIKLPKHQMNNLSNFLKYQKKTKSNLPKIQCSEFCNLVNWVKNFNGYTKKQIHIHEINNIKISESLIICETWEEENNFRLNNNLFIKKPFFHFAIYIWNWLYISKFWKWNIYITTFEEMYKIYNYSNFYILNKKEN